MLGWLHKAVNCNPYTASSILPATTPSKIMQTHYLILVPVTRLAVRNSVSVPKSFHLEYFPL